MNSANCSVGKVTGITMCVPERLKHLHGQKLPGTPKYSVHLNFLVYAWLLKETKSTQIQLTAYTCHHAATCGVTYCTPDPVCAVAECLSRRFGATYRLKFSRATGPLERPDTPTKWHSVTCRKTCKLQHRCRKLQ